MNTRSTAAAAASAFSGRERKSLAMIADMIVPASDEYGVPGAGDEKILAAIIRSAEPHHLRLQQALAAFAELSQASENPGDAFRLNFPEEAEILQALTVQNYYSDDRVMRSLGMENRPPFPGGYSLDQGDWSLLDPVRQRAEFFRNTS